MLSSNLKAIAYNFLRAQAPLYRHVLAYIRSLDKNIRSESPKSPICLQENALKQSLYIQPGAGPLVNYDYLYRIAVTIPKCPNSFADLDITERMTFCIQ